VTSIMKNGSRLAAFVVLACAALVRAQEAPSPLARAQAPAAEALAASPVRDARLLRGEPDADSDVEPLEALGNFHAVETGFYRSAQPNKEGYVLLRNLGVKTILTLKGDADEERKLAEPLGMKVENVEMSGFKAPTFEQMDRALRVLTTAPRPLLVHCEHGKDRTGFVVASYRVAVERMSIPAAVAEAKSAGCCFVMFEDLATYLEKYRLRRGAFRR
jgi:protein tyrosine/serine phosphatase